MADLFVSYSRRDGAFVRRLATALEDRGKDVWVDVQGIRDAEVFPEALRRAIESSDAFVFVISPDSVNSSFCGEELEHAARLNKRIVPIALRHVSDAEVPEQVRVRNWIPAAGGPDFETLLDRLVKALDTDLEWERQHSRLTVKALEWEQSSRERSFLLRGADLHAAEGWLAAGADKDPGPTALESEYVASGRAAASRRQRNVASVSVAVAGISLGLLVFALISLFAAVHARNLAKAQALTSDAERVGAKALVEPTLDRAMLDAVLAVKLKNSIETRGDLLALLQKNYAAIRVIRPSHDQITALAGDPRGHLLAIGDAAGVVRFENMLSWTADGSAVRVKGFVTPMAFSPRGGTLAVVSIQAARANLYAVDLANRNVRLLGSWPGAFPSTPYAAASLAYDPSGRRIALTLASSPPTAFAPLPKNLMLLDAATGRVIWQRRYPSLPGQEEAHVAFAPNGTLITSTQQGETLLWNAETGRVVRRFPIGGQPAVSADGKTLGLAVNTPSLASTSSHIVVLDLRSGRHRTLAAGLPSSWITSLAFTPDGARLVGGDLDGVVHIWEVATGALSETFAGPSANVSGVALLDPTGRTALFGSWDGSVIAFDLSGTRRLGRIFHWNQPAQGCAAPPCYVVNRQSSLMATDQADGSTALIDLQSLRKVATLPARDGPLANAIAFFPDGRTLLTGGIARRLTVWNVRSRKATRTISLGQPVWLAAVSPNGRLIAAQTQAPGSTSSRVQVRALDSGRLLWARRVPDGATGFYIPQDGAVGLQFSPDGRELTAVGCCAPGSVVVSWAAASGKPLFERRLGAPPAVAFAYSPNSRVLAVGTENGRVLFWNTRTGVQQAPPLQVTGAGIGQISFSSDGRQFVVGSFDARSTLWDLRSRKQIGSSFPEQLNAIPAPSFEPNGRLLIEYLADGAQWPTDVPTWERFACQIAGRDVTRAEWRAILPNRPYMHICPASG